MILYRPHRGGYQEAMALAREFDSIDSMKEYIVQEHTDEDMGPAFSVKDIVIGEEEKYDSRNGWNTRYVCVKRYHNETFSVPACIGMCGTIINEITRETLTEKKIFTDLREGIFNLQAPMMDNTAANLTIVYPNEKAED